MAHQGSSNKGSPSGGMREQDQRRQYQQDDANRAANRTTEEAGTGTARPSGLGARDEVQQTGMGSPPAPQQNAQMSGTAGGQRQHTATGGGEPQQASGSRSTQTDDAAKGMRQQPADRSDSADDKRGR